MIRLGIVTGLVAEADILAKSLARCAGGADRTLVRAAGPGPVRATAAAERLVAGGAGALMSFGLAAGVDPDLTPGTLVVAEAIVDPGGRRLDADGDWRDRLVATAGALHPMTVAVIAGADAALADAAAKRFLFESSGAAAGDMESHAVAAVAAAANLPFLALRAVADPASRSVPRAALAGLMPDGRTRALPVLGAVAARPGELLDVVRLALDGRTAMTALRRVAARAAPFFGLVEAA